ncbi:hypothetical protein JHJ27_002899 [Escherichia coli]|uniref:hypothetical protein n=1 Tax=Escherichia coli TaxID=562 RepID=UPI000FA46574|nr:hypothetical protein [Escherichia coli]EED1400161.1 hypothetical protein [Escherichia coli]EGX8883612.1 hypothetical protein [Escherichia coli]MBU5994381.1 hypothetical protein [Escherichia coli]HAG6587202.1 hypothetical protein [Escherichia coli]
MARRATVTIVFVEGETELSLFKKMKRDNIIAVKEVVKKNFWQDRIHKYAIAIPKGSDIFVVFDSDQVEQSARFIENVKFLRSRGHRVYLFQQTSNFEEELSWCCNKSIPRLIYDFCGKKTSGVNDFKRDFIACNNSPDKLIKLGIREHLWFSRALHDVLKPVADMKSNFSRHFRLAK